MSKNIISNDIKHDVKVHNSQGNEVNISIDFGNMIQVNAITKMFSKFDEFKAYTDIDTGLPFDELANIIDKIAMIQEELNTELTKAFGKDLLVEIFNGDGSIPMYVQFFELLKIEVENAQKKIDKFTKDMRQKDLLQGHKKADNVL